MKKIYNPILRLSNLCPASSSSGGGFVGLAAARDEYKVTGVMTFIVSHDGIVCQKDLGIETLDIFTKIERYNPDKTWSPTDDQK